MTLYHIFDQVTKFLEELLTCVTLCHGDQIKYIVRIVNKTIQQRYQCTKAAASSSGEVTLLYLALCTFMVAQVLGSAVTEQIKCDIVFVDHLSSSPKVLL